MEKVKIFVDTFRRDPVTSTCGLIFLICYYIVSNPTSIDFLGAAASGFIISLCEFFRGISVAVGLAFAAQSRPGGNLGEKDVIPEVLAENQPEGKIELKTELSEEVKPKKKRSRKAPAKKKTVRRKSTKKEEDEVVKKSPAKKVPAKKAPSKKVPTKKLPQSIK